MSFEKRFVVPKAASEVLTDLNLRRVGIGSESLNGNKDVGKIGYLPHELDPGTPLHPVIDQPLAESNPNFTETKLLPETSYPKAPPKTM